MYMTQESVATIPDPAGREPEREAPEASPASSSFGSTVPYSPENFTRDPDSQAGAAQQRPGDEERFEPDVQEVKSLADAKAAGRLLEFESQDRDDLNDAMSVADSVVSSATGFNARQQEKCIGPDIEENHNTRDCVSACSWDP